MPLHDWSRHDGWDSVHYYWIGEIIQWLKPRLPPGYRPFPGSVPTLMVGDVDRRRDETSRPGVTVRQWEPPARSSESNVDSFAPEHEAVVAFATEPLLAVHVERRGVLIAAVELVSPRNKDRLSSQQESAERYAAYLRRGVHLLLIDVFPRPAGFSFPDAIAADVGFNIPPCPAPCAASFRVGEPAGEGTFQANRQVSLAVGQPLPSLPLALNVFESVPVDLDVTYARAAAEAYLE